MPALTLTAAQVANHPQLRDAVVDLLYQLADDDLVLGHRDSEWLGLAPEIEEDVALSSIAQDEVGHAAFYYELLSELGEGEADGLAFHRSAEVRRNALLAERDNGDWAYTIARHYLYDVFEDARLQVLENSSYLPLRQGAVKIRREEYYHLLHFETWFRRLGVAGGEALERMENAVRALWPDLWNLLDLGPHAEVLREHGVFPVYSEDLRHTVLSRVTQTMLSAGLKVPETVELQYARGNHTDSLSELLATMCEVREADPQAVW